MAKSGAVYVGTLKKALGSDVATKLLHKCRYYLSYRAKFVDGLRALIEADKVLFGGNHVEQIKEVLAGRGISTARRK